MRGESWKHTRFLLRCFKESEETHRKRCFLKVAVYIFRTLQPHWRTSCSLLCKYNARFEITASGAMWLVLAEPGLNIHCALSTPLNTKLRCLVTWVWLCCPTVLTWTLPFSIHTLSKSPIEVVHLSAPHFISNQITPLLFVDLCRKHANFGLDCYLWALWCPFPLTATNLTDTLLLHSNRNLPLHFTAFCSQVMRMPSCDKQTVRGSGLRGAVWAGGWKWIIPRCLSRSPSASQDLIVSECRVHARRGLGLRCLSVCNLASLSLCVPQHTTSPSVKSDTAAAPLHSVCNPAN